MPEELKSPEYDPRLAYLYRWFMQLNRSRQSGAYGPNPISYQEIKAWSQMTARRVMSWEVDVIKQIDTVYLETLYG